MVTSRLPTVLSEIDVNIQQGDLMQLPGETGYVEVAMTQETSSGLMLALDEANNLRMVNLDSSQGARQLFQSIADAFDEESVTFGEFTVEVTVPQSVAGETEAAANSLPVSFNRTDV
jgi:hypothetical protein